MTAELRTAVADGDVSSVRTAPIRVVLADDSAAIRTLVRYSLTAGRGFSLVGEATNGAEALTLTASQLPDCVVLDIEMPGMGGLEALAQLRQRHPSIPVVMLSGFLDPAVRARTHAAGASATLDKSTDMKRLPYAVREVLHQTVDPSSTTDTADLTADSAAIVSPLPAQPSPDASLVELRRLEYVVGHDLGEPVRIIGGFTNLLRERYAADLDASGTAFLDDIADAAGRLRSMLDDLLTYGRAGHAEAKLEGLDVRKLVLTVYEDLASTLSDTRAVATVGDSAMVVGDPDLLKTVLTHAVVNAVTFNTATIPEVHITAQAAGESTIITVQDNGIGIRADHCGRVFDLFQRLNTREEYAGNGLGLALCRRLVTLQGGTIEIASSAGEGSCLTISLPAAAPSRTAPPLSVLPATSQPAKDLAQEAS